MDLDPARQTIAEVIAHLKRPGRYIEEVAVPVIDGLRGAAAAVKRDVQASSALRLLAECLVKERHFQRAVLDERAAAEDERWGKARAKLKAAVVDAKG